MRGVRRTQRHGVAKVRTPATRADIAPVRSYIDPSIVTSEPRRSNVGRVSGATSNGYATYPASRISTCDVCLDAVVPGEQIVDFPTPQNGEAVRHFRCTPKIGAKPV